jgi:hypothetical protein
MDGWGNPVEQTATIFTAEEFASIHDMEVPASRQTLVSHLQNCIDSKLYNLEMET